MFEIMKQARDVGTGSLCVYILEKGVFVASVLWTTSQSESPRCDSLLGLFEIYRTRLEMPELNSKNAHGSQ